MVRRGAWMGVALGLVACGGAATPAELVDDFPLRLRAGCSTESACSPLEIEARARLKQCENEGGSCGARKVEVAVAEEMLAAARAKEARARDDEKRRLQALAAAAEAEATARAQAQAAVEEEARRALEAKCAKERQAVLEYEAKRTAARAEAEKKRAARLPLKGHPRPAPGDDEDEDYVDATVSNNQAPGQIARRAIDMPPRLSMECGGPDTTRRARTVRH